jgi:hypothetical protein
MGKVSLSAVKPLRVSQFAKGYIEIVDGREPIEVFVHVFLFKQIVPAEVKKLDAHYKQQLSDFEVVTEYIPEVDSVCLSIKHENLPLVKNTILGKIEMAAKQLLD